MDVALDLANAIDIESAALAQLLCHALRNDAELFLRLASMCLDLELDAEVILRRPDLGHLRPAVTRDHAVAISSYPSFLSVSTIWGGTGAVTSSTGRAGYSGSLIERA